MTVSCIRFPKTCRLSELEARSTFARAYLKVGMNTEVVKSLLTFMLPSTQSQWPTGPFGQLRCACHFPIMMRKKLTRTQKQSQTRDTCPQPKRTRSQQDNRTHQILIKHTITQTLKAINMANSTKLISNMASRGIAKKRFQAIKSSHAKQVKGCVALPTLGRNQSMFDTHKYQDEMQSEPLGLSSGELSRASMISEQQEQEMSASTTITNSTSSTISDFFHAQPFRTFSTPGD